MTLDDLRSASILDRWISDLKAAANAGKTGHPTIKEAPKLPNFDDPPNPPGARRSQLETAWKNLVDQHINNPKRQLLFTWRHLRDDLAREIPAWAYLEMPGKPAGCSVWDHLDTVAREELTNADGHVPAFLSFSLGPVQSYIAAARSVRDLWTGSYLLAYLTYKAMLPVLDACGPSALVFPSLRGMPLIDDWLKSKSIQTPGHDTEAGREARLIPCLPNRFLAIVPAGENGKAALNLAADCEQACHEALSALASDIREKVVDNIINKLPEKIKSGDWDRFWSAQISTYFEIRSAILPWNEASAEALNTAIPDPTADDNAPRSLYAKQLSLQFGLLEAVRSVRHVPNYDAHQVAKAEQYPQKCSLLGTHEQMGPAELSASKDFWEAVSKKSLGRSRVRSGERFGAISLVKRFAWPAFLSGELELDPEARRFADTATIAAREWLQSAGIDPREHENWSGQWLHPTEKEEDDTDESAPDQVDQMIRAKSRPKPDGHGSPPSYYAVLAIDGDHMGQWIQGRKLPEGRTFGPEVHNAISAALNHYALHAVPAIVNKYQGELIYAGGDDVLAFFPTALAIACAQELREAFAEPNVPGDPSRHTLGPKATMSGGLVIAHYKEDLRFVLEEARAAEKQAKNAGRDALTLRILKRSGEHSSIVLPWNALEALNTLVEHFKDGMTDRWAYALRADLPTIRGLPKEAFFDEALRQVRRVEEKAHKEFLCNWVETQAKALICTLKNRCRSCSEAMEDLVMLCQSASFLARGRDNR